MPKKEVHLELVDHNKDFVTFIEKNNGIPPFQDWGVTVLFYTALHQVHAFLAERGKHPETHGEINLYLQRERIDLDIRLEYTRLRNLSEQARYQKACFHEDEFREEIRKDCMKIIEYFQGLMSRSTNSS